MKRPLVLVSPIVFGFSAPIAGLLVPGFFYISSIGGWAFSSNIYWYNISWSLFLFVAVLYAAICLIVSYGIVLVSTGIRMARGRGLRYTKLALVGPLIAALGFGLLSSLNHWTMPIGYGPDTTVVTFHGWPVWYMAVPIEWCARFSNFPPEVDPFMALFPCYGGFSPRRFAWDLQFYLGVSLLFGYFLLLLSWAVPELRKDVRKFLFKTHSDPRLSRSDA